MTSTRIEWIARPGEHTGTSGTQFTVEPSSMMTNNDAEFVRMKDFDLTRMNGHEEIEIAEVDLPPTSTYGHESASPV